MRNVLLVSSVLALTADVSGASAADHPFCDTYAKTAIQQYLEAKTRKLPNTDPPVWSPDYDLHYNWCRGVDEWMADRGTYERSKVLAAGKPLPPSPKATTTLVPGLIIGLRHTYCKYWGNRAFGCASATDCQFGNNDSLYNPTVMHSSRLDYRCGGDIGAKQEFGFSWNTVNNDTPFTVPYDQLPPGIVIGLWHSGNQQRKESMVAGTLAFDGYSTPTGLVRVNGGDLGAPSGVGYFWFETTGANFVGDWTVADRLPKYSVIGLRHTRNMKARPFVWKGIAYDAGCGSCAPPPDYVRVSGGDLGAPTGHGFVWFEKVTGPEPNALH